MSTNASITGVRSRAPKYMFGGRTSIRAIRYWPFGTRPVLVGVHAEPAAEAWPAETNGPAEPDDDPFRKGSVSNEGVQTPFTDAQQPSAFAHRNHELLAHPFSSLCLFCHLSQIGPVSTRRSSRLTHNAGRS